MCGIPMLPPSDMAAGKKLTFEQALGHIGGAEGFISAEGRRLIAANSREYIWKYPDHGYCTACGQDVGDMKARHGRMVTCPECGAEVEFRHESRGHRREFWQFCLYEWRRSLLDPEAVVLTATHVFRDSRRTYPEEAPKVEAPLALYVFRPGEAVTLYKSYYRWDAHDWDRGWQRMNEVTPAHTSYESGSMRVVWDYMAFHDALEGTRIGRTYDLLRDGRGYDTMAQLIDVVASCARRPWLEYIAKSGQPYLARELMECRRIPRTVIGNQRARTPRELLGLTEAQWHEVRRDRVALDMRTLECFHYLRRMGLGDGHIADMLPMTRCRYDLEHIAPQMPWEKRAQRYEPPHIGDFLTDTPPKLRRRAFRRIITQGGGHYVDWRDYYQAMRACGEDFTDAALVAPRDFAAMHDRMIARAQMLKKEADARARREAEAAFQKRLEDLRRDYDFRAAGLVLRPFENREEIVAEGRTLRICIGGYADRYIDGGTIICCLRRAEEPDVPWRAVEFSTLDGRRVQDRGYINDRNGIEPGTQKQLRLFWEAFDRAHNRKRRKNA